MYVWAAAAARLFKRLYLLQRVTAAENRRQSRGQISPSSNHKASLSIKQKLTHSDECVCVYLVNLVPAVLILAANGGVVVQQQLAAAGVSPHHHAVVQRRQTAAVLIVWRRSQLQQRLDEAAHKV